MAVNRLFSFLVSMCACITASEAKAENTFSVGVEGFYDHYTESGSVGVDERSDYGSVDLRYINTSKQGFITEADLRGSYGTDDYKSPSGVISGIPQYETEFRLVSGLIIPAGPWTVTPYIGGASRFFYDNNKGNHTNLGFFGYDRRILQFYVPVGGTFKRTFNGWTYDTTLEYDQMFYGKVNSRLANGGQGDKNITNTQSSGYGFRGDFLVGKTYKNVAWEVGPFFRYWEIENSQTASDQTTGALLIEPKNQRLQVGLEGRVNF